MSPTEPSPPLDLSPQVAPFSWLFRRAWTAGLAMVLLFTGSWLAHVFLRRTWFPNELIFWKDELTMLGAFIAAGMFSLFLPRLFCRLCKDLIAQRSSLAGNFERQYQRFHDHRWLVWLPPALAGLSILIRYVGGGEFNPFFSWGIDYAFSFWLFLGFCAILHATVLCARYTEVAHLLKEEAADGRLGRNEIHALSRFYLKVALVATIHFGLCAMVVSAINMIYTYRGAMVWSPFDLIRWRKGLTLGQQLVGMLRDPLFPDVATMLVLHAAVSIAPVVYLLFPQWDIHKLLVRRKEGLLERARQELEEVEGRLTPKASSADFTEFSLRSRNLETLEKLPEWPFGGGGKLGTLFLVVLPTLLVLLKEVFLEAFVSLLVK